MQHTLKSCEKLLQTFLLQICQQAAERIMELLSTWRTLYKPHYCPVTLIQITFSAGTMYLLIAMQASSGIRNIQEELRHPLDQETLVQQYLQEIRVSWSCVTIIIISSWLNSSRSYWSKEFSHQSRSAHFCRYWYWWRKQLKSLSFVFTQTVLYN